MAGFRQAARVPARNGASLGPSSSPSATPRSPTSCRDDRRLQLLFVGINPGLWTAATQTHFAHPVNRFYPALLAAGIIERPIDPAAGMTDADREHLDLARHRHHQRRAPRHRPRRRAHRRRAPRRRRASWSPWSSGSSPGSSPWPGSPPTARRSAAGRPRSAGRRRRSAAPSCGWSRTRAASTPTRRSPRSPRRTPRPRGQPAFFSPDACLGTGPPLVEPVETAAAKAGSRPCGHLDKLDER